MRVGETRALYFYHVLEVHHMSALDALLKADLNIEKKVYIDRLKTHFTIRAVTSEDTEQIKEESTHYTGKANKLVKKQDSIKGMYLTVLKGSVDPDFNDASLKEKAKVSTSWEVVKTLLLPGECQKLEQEILILSGFHDDDSEEESFEEIKN
jgi:hypothetical protein